MGLTAFFLALMVMKLRHDMKGSGVGGLVDVPGTCVLKIMMLHDATLRHVVLEVASCHDGGPG